MRCDQCQFWSEEAAGWETGEIGFRHCNAVKERWEIADGSHGDAKHYPHGDQVGAEKWAQERKGALKASRAFVEDGSEYYAALLTGPDFFCALFKQK